MLRHAKFQNAMTLFAFVFAVHIACAQEPGAAPIMPHPNKGQPISVLKLELSASAKTAPIGTPIELTATLTNTSAEEVSLPDLVFDERSLSFDIEFKGKPWHYSRIRGEVEMPPPLAAEKVAAGAKLDETIKLILPEAGKVTITAIYRGVATKPVVSTPIEIETTSTEAGDRVLARFSLKHGENAGEFVIEFNPEVAFGTVLNFLALAGDGFYDNTKIHRVVRGFMSQGGDPNTKNDNPSDDGMGGPGYSLPGEFDPKRFKSMPHELGVISMARRQHADSASSQFFICSKNARFLDNQYTAFGRIVSGIDVAEACNQIPTQASPGNPKEVSQPITPLALLSVKLEVGKAAGGATAPAGGK